jgi:hypothetical protein
VVISHQTFVDLETPWYTHTLASGLYCEKEGVIENQNVLAS